jgi:hypothetical protein
LFPDKGEYYPPQAILRIMVFCEEENYQKWVESTKFQPALVA